MLTCVLLLDRKYHHDVCGLYLYIGCHISSTLNLSTSFNLFPVCIPVWYLSSKLSCVENILCIWNPARKVGINVTVGCTCKINLVLSKKYVTLNPTSFN